MIELVEAITAGLIGAFIGAALVRQHNAPQADLDASLERCRDAAVSFAEAVLGGFDSTTQWDKFRQAREEYLTEARED